MSAPVLHRDNPAKDPLVGNAKVTRADWLNAALAVLKSDGVESVNISELASKMSVSRSSFYWYFKDHTDLLNALLEERLAMVPRYLVAFTGTEPTEDEIQAFAAYARDVTEASASA